MNGRAPVILQNRMSILNNKWVILLFRLFLGVLLFYTGYHKISESPEEFAQVIRLYEIGFLAPFSNLIALVFPWLELFVGFCLIFGIFLDGALLLTFGLMGVFFVVVFQAVLRGITGDCGCGIFAEEHLGWWKVLQNSLYFIMSYHIWNTENHLLRAYPK